MPICSGVFILLQNVFYFSGRVTWEKVQTLKLQQETAQLDLDNIISSCEYIY